MVLYLDLNSTFPYSEIFSFQNGLISPLIQKCLGHTDLLETKFTVWCLWCFTDEICGSDQLCLCWCVILLPCVSTTVCPHPKSCSVRSRQIAKFRTLFGFCWVCPCITNKNQFPRTAFLSFFEVGSCVFLEKNVFIVFQRWKEKFNNLFYRDNWSDLLMN